jgi:hypothetical protein
MAVQQPGKGKKHDWRDVGGVTLGIELFEPITQGKQQLRLGRMQVGRGEIAGPSVQGGKPVRAG